MKSVVIGIDIGGSHIKSAAVDLHQGDFIQGSESEVKVNNKEQASVILKEWATGINGTVKKVGNNRIVGLGFAMPGPFNYKEGIALFEGNDKYESLFGVNIEENLKPLLILENDVEFRFHNDASCFAIGEDGYGKAKGYSKSISVTLGTGFGSAFIDNGIPIVHRPDVPTDGCLWHLPFKEGIADDYFSTRWFENNYSSLRGEQILGVKEIADRAQHDKQVSNLFHEFGVLLGQFLSDWIRKFQAEVIVIGGNISGAVDLFTPGLRSSLQENGIKVPFKVSELMESAALIGSARLLDDTYYSKLKDHLPTK